jgi:hypothetical protein
MSSMTNSNPEPASSPCQAPPGYWDEADVPAKESDEKTPKLEDVVRAGASESESSQPREGDRP